MPFLTVDGARLHYQRIGEGSPLLLLAGMMSDGASWTPVIESLSQSHELIILDNRCTGQSTPPLVTTSRELMLDDILQLLDALKLESVAVLGHSMGAMLGWALAARAPDRVTCLIGASALPVISAARVDLFNTLVAIRHSTDQRLWYRQLFQWLFSPAFFDNAERVESAIDDACQYAYQQSTEAFEQQALALPTFDASIALSEIRCPVQCIGGTNDLLLPPANLFRFHQSMQNDSVDPYLHCSTLRTPVIIEDAAHALHWEQPVTFVEAVCTALED